MIKLTTLLKEIEIKIPSRKLFDAEIVKILQNSENNGGYIEYKVKCFRDPSIPIMQGHQYKESLYGKDNEISIYFWGLNNNDNLSEYLTKYLDKYKVKYTVVEEDDTIIVSAEYFRIINPNNVQMTARPNFNDILNNLIFDELNEIEVHIPNTGIFTAAIPKEYTNDNGRFIYFDLYYKDELLSSQLYCTFDKESNEIIWYPNGLDDKKIEEILQILDKKKIPYEYSYNKVRFDPKKAIKNYSYLLSL